MRIGIDISQIAYQGTGVANFVLRLVEHLIEEDSKNEYVLFYSSLRRKLPESKLWTKNANGRIQINPLKNGAKNVTVSEFKFPPSFLDLLWNRLHIFPIEQLIGPVDIFISSDWTQPPTKAKKVTILYDLIVYKYPEETHNQTRFNFKNFILASNIVAAQKRRLRWVKKEVDKIICISEATKKDAMEILKINENRLKVVVPGI